MKRLRDYNVFLKSLINVGKYMCLYFTVYFILANNVGTLVGNKYISVCHCS
jgi:hypothetical protein